VSFPPVKALGVDDWAWRKGQRYGTILVDLERHQPIDLLPDRESGTLEKWLEAHPGVEIISRDRAGAYADGARKGAPQALQVADRFHLLCNLTQAMQRLLERLAVALRRSQISEAALSKDLSSTDGAGTPSEAPVTVSASEPFKLNRHQQQSQQRRERRKARYEAVRAADQRGLTQRAIAREFGLTRKTVRRFLQATDFPEQAPRRRRTALEPHREYLEKRWAEGCHNASRLWRELQQKGYTGQLSRVKEFLQPWRSQGPKPKLHLHKLPGLRLVAFWLCKPAGDRKEKEQQWVQSVTNDHPEITTAENLAQRFRDMVKNRKAGDLDVWLESAETSGVPEFQGFAMGIRRDHAAVVAGLEQSWSNGQVEGQVHRLKLLKRQMYGRAGFLLLRARVLPFPCGAGGYREAATLVKPALRSGSSFAAWMRECRRLGLVFDAPDGKLVKTGGPAPVQGAFRGRGYSAEAIESTNKDNNLPTESLGESPPRRPSHPEPPRPCLGCRLGAKSFVLCSDSIDSTVSTPAPGKRRAQQPTRGPQNRAGFHGAHRFRLCPIRTARNRPKIVWRKPGGTKPWGGFNRAILASQVPRVHRSGRVLTAVPSPTGDGTDGVPGQGTPRHRTWELAPIPLPGRPRRLPASYQRVPRPAGACRGA